MPRERKAKEEKTGYRTDLGLLEAVVSIAGNLFLFTVKLIIGIAIGSMAAIADAVHTFSRFWWLPGTLWRSGAGTRWTPFWGRPLPGWSSIPGGNWPSLPATGCWGPRPHRRC